MSTVVDACPVGTTTFTILSRITRISGSGAEINAFHDCSETLQNFQFQDSEPQLEVIEKYAFYQCKQLQKIDLSLCNKLTSIGDYAFSECNSVSSILLPESLKSLGIYCFSQILNVAEVTVPASVSTIQSHIFFQCSSLKKCQFQKNSSLQMLTRWMIGGTLVEEFTVPKSVTSIVSSTFEVSYKLVNIFVEEGSRTYADDNGVLYSLDYTTLISYPVSHGASYKIHDKCLLIEYASFGNSRLSSIELNDKLKTIGDYGFQSTLISSISLPDTTTTIGNYAFNGCKSLKTIKFPANLTKFSKYMLANCDFTNFTVPESIQTIQEFCFYNNSRLQLVILPINLQSLGGGAFSNCHKDIEIRFPDNSPFKLLNREFIVDVNVYNITQYLGSNQTVTLPDTVQIIKAGAFQRNTNIVEIICGDNLKTIDEKAFSSCSQLQSIDLSSVEIISKYAFELCTSLISVEFGDKLISISEYAFQNCTDLESITFAQTSNPYYLEQYSFYYCTKLKNLTLSPSLRYIEQYAFAYSTSLLGVNFPSSIQSIGKSCFEGSGITEVQFEDLTSSAKRSAKESPSITELGESCFKDCSKLSSLSLPDSVQSIGSLCFSNTSINEFEVPLFTKTIGDQCFTNCPNLKKFIIPEKSSLETIGNKPFSGCHSLSEIVSNTSNFVIITGGLYTKTKEKLIAFPPASPIKYFTLSENVKYISPGAFSDCTTLQIITIPDDSATEIGFSAFEGCINLRTINIPSSVTSIDTNAFANCKSLRCGLSIDETDEAKLKLWVEVAKLPQICISECKEKTCFTKYANFNLINLIFIILGTV